MLTFLYYTTVLAQSSDKVYPSLSHTSAAVQLYIVFAILVHCIVPKKTRKQIGNIKNRIIATILHILLFYIFPVFLTFGWIIFFQSIGIPYPKGTAYPWEIFGLFWKT